MANPLEVGRDEYLAVNLAVQGLIRGGLALDVLDDEQADAIKDAAADWSARWEGATASDWQTERDKWGDDWSLRENDISGWRNLLGLAGGLGVNVQPYLEQTAADEFARVPLPPEVAYVSATVKEAAAATDFWNPWDKPTPPCFPIDCLPPDLASAAYDAHLRLGADLGATGMATVAGIAGAADSRHGARVRKHSADWVENPRLWVMLVGDPSAKKTPTINAALRPHRDQEKRDLATYRMAKDVWDQTPKDERGPEPMPTAYLLNDPGPEATANLLQRWPRGSFLHLDELSGWISGMDRYTNGKGGGANRAFWLQAYQGGHFRQDRIGRGTTFVENLSISIIGGIQPDRLKQMTDLADDGLLQRFIPILMGRSTPGVDRPPAPEIEVYNSLVRRLMASQPRIFRLSENGYRIREDAASEYMHHASDDTYGSGFAQFVGKGEALLMRPALTLHLAMPGTLDQASDVIADGTLQRACCLMDYVIRSAAIFYSDWTGGPTSKDTKALASWILRSDQGQIALRDVVRNVRCFAGLDEPTALKKVSVLVGAGWLTPISNGYPAKNWGVAPNLRAFFADRIREDRERCSTALDLIRQSAEVRRADRTSPQSPYLDDAA